MSCSLVGSTGIGTITRRKLVGEVHVEMKTVTERERVREKSKKTFLDFFS